MLISFSRLLRWVRNHNADAPITFRLAAITHKWLAFLIVALGGVLEGLYTVALIGISRDRRARDIPSLSACFISVCALAGYQTTRSDRK
jgi:hypothetical protein